MGRPKRAAKSGIIYHALNRANARMTLFEHAGGYEAFEGVIEEATERTKMRLLVYGVMPNHWRLMSWPREDGDLSRYMGWLTLTHTQHWHVQHGSVGTGHVYHRRFKSFPVQSDDHFLTLCRFAVGMLNVR